MSRMRVLTWSGRGLKEFLVELSLHYTLLLRAHGVNRVEARRDLNIHEYQSYGLLNEYGVRTPQHIVGHRIGEIEHQIKTLDAERYVVKAQILAGGRGKGTFADGYQSGVQFADNHATAIGIAHRMLGNRLITKQTSEHGETVRTVMVSEALSIARELYLAVLLDFASQSPAVIACPKGGTSIEEAAKKHPELIQNTPFPIDVGISGVEIERVARHLHLDVAQIAQQLEALCRLFVDVDATQVEINPLVVTTDNRVCAVDAKLNFDNSAKFRQKRIFEMGDAAQAPDDEIDVATLRERRAAQYLLKYIPLDGHIACIVNGAGLAMATMDTIQLHGSAPANFLDIGGRVDAAGVAHSLELVAEDESVTAILVNIFGGIVNCALVARGIVEAVHTLPRLRQVPVVVRLEGTQATEARQILEESGEIKFITATDLDDGAMKAIAASQAVIKSMPSTISDL